MNDPSLPLQGALVTALKADVDVAAIVADRVYDMPPGPTPTFPYVSWGSAQVLPEKFDCIEGTEIHLTIDAWSRQPGYPEVKRIADAVISAIDEQPPTISGFSVLELQLEQVNYLADPDGLTRHASIVFRALIDGQ
jgi:hypothetical protein